jgi:hypothetical protein
MSYIFLPISERPEWERELEDDEELIQRHIVFRAMFLVRQGINKHLATKCPKKEVKVRSKIFQLMDDNLFFEQAINSNMSHFKDPVTGEK